ncbi:MAG: hypothetical protein FWE45_00490 [Firmicutes bacterium]|nr:hypothetical protein [Bacillota bacterium]
MESHEGQLAALARELTEKTKEYHQLCQELNDVKSIGIDPNDKRLVDLLFRFQCNNAEIKDINTRMRKLEENK